MWKLNRFGRILLLLACMGGAASCRLGTVVPPGVIVIILDADGEIKIHRQGVYKAYGRDRIYFVDTKLKGYTESMKILCKDDVNMSVDVKWVGSFAIQEKHIKFIKEKVPSEKVDSGDISGYRLSLNKFYETAIRDIIRSITRLEVSPYVTDSIPSNRIKIGAAIKKRVLERLKKLNYPLETADVLLSNLDYPPSVQRHREEIKKAELEDLKSAALAKARVRQAERDEDIAREEGKAELERAKAKAAANRILTKSITPELLAMRQWDVLEAMAAGPNNEVIVIPYEAIKPQVLDTVISRRSMRGALEDSRKQ
jgi:regulator of protease activity HflC (stomatin/prohibitin superfamily)